VASRFTVAGGTTRVGTIGATGGALIVFLFPVGLFLMMFPPFLVISGSRSMRSMSIKMTVSVSRLFKITFCFLILEQIFLVQGIDCNSFSYQLQ
jgi:hypothetical protein